jgi:hypothetical protein
MGDSPNWADDVLIPAYEFYKYSGIATYKLAKGVYKTARGTSKLAVSQGHRLTKAAVHAKSALGF